MKNAEECLREAEECDRLVDLANTQGTRTLLMVAAFQWRKLAEKAAERSKFKFLRVATDGTVIYLRPRIGDGFGSATCSAANRRCV